MANRNNPRESKKPSEHERLVAAHFLKKNPETPLAAALFQFEKREAKVTEKSHADLSQHFDELKRIGLLVDNVPIEVVIEESKWLKRVGVDSILIFATQHWPAIVGFQLGTVTFPTRYEKDKKRLRVSTVSAVAHNEITYKRTAIINAMNDFFEQVVVEDVLFSKMMVR